MSCMRNRAEHAELVKPRHFMHGWSQTYVLALHTHVVCKFTDIGEPSWTLSF